MRGARRGVESKNGGEAEAGRRHLNVRQRILETKELASDTLKRKVHLKLMGIVQHH